MASPPDRSRERYNARVRMLRLGCLANVVLLSALVAVPVALFGTLSSLLRGGTPAGEQEAIRGVLDAQVAGWNRGDLDAFMTGYWNSDALQFTSEDRVTRGWQATKERYVKRYRADGKEMGTLAFEELEVEGLTPTAAVARGRYVLTTAKGADVGRFTLVFRRFPDGWKITSDHTSARCPECK